MEGDIHFIAPDGKTAGFYIPIEFQKEFHSRIKGMPGLKAWNDDFSDTLIIVHRYQHRQNPDFRRVCAWCGKVLSCPLDLIKDVECLVESDTSLCRDCKMVTSHGICVECKKRMTEEMELDG
jgi:hypothetical protein